MRLPAGELRPGQEFRTCLTGRNGTVLEVKKTRGVEVCMDASPVGEVVWIHTAVLVEVMG